MSAAQLSGYVEGVGLLGPGLPDWPAAVSVLRAQVPFARSATVLPVPAQLSGAERRRVSPLVKLTLAAGLEACVAADVDAATLPAVFTSSGGDGANCHEICSVLAGDRQISPTRFHNSVHNAASGYWGIATQATTASNALCAFDASFGAGLLEALCQAAVEKCRVLLIAYDAAYPEPLRSARPIPDAFAVALVLAPERSERSLARVDVCLSEAPADAMPDAALEELRSCIPAARSLPFLDLLARADTGEVVLDYLDTARLAMRVSPCR
jgi:Beta-ketoacyl synthase, N-terminal domain